MATFFIALLLCGVTLGAVVPTTIPFGGIPAASSIPNIPVPRQQFGQVVNGISDVISFSFWVAAVDAGTPDSSATASIALWSGTSAGAPLFTVPISLTTSSAYARVTATFNQLGLDPVADYLLYFNVSGVPQYDFFTNASTTDGGLVQGLDGVWTSGYGRDAFFDFSFNSVINVPFASNYAQGPGPTADTFNPRWGCKVQTSFGTLQVNWQTLLINTAYFANVTNSVIYQAQSGCSSVHAPYGTAAACWDLQPGQAWSYGSIDLSGTHYKITSTFTAGGFLGSGAVTFSNGNQTAALSVSGDCGSAQVQGTPYDFGGWYIQLARV